MNSLITGASRGLGYAMAIAMAKPGNTLFVHYNKSTSAAKSCIKAIEAQGAKAILIRADLSEESGVKRVIDTMHDRAEGLDVLINNAGVMPKYRAKTISWRAMQKVFAVNVQAVLALSLGLRPLLEKTSAPCIINLSSGASMSGFSLLQPEYYGMFAYAASKGALDTLTRGLARVLAPIIRVNAIAPGFVPTDMHQSRVENVDQENDFLDQAKLATPLQLLGKDADINLVLDMLIQNRYMTGQCVHVNGGLWMG